MESSWAEFFLDEVRLTDWGRKWALTLSSCELSLGEMGSVESSWAQFFLDEVRLTDSGGK